MKNTLKSTKSKGNDAEDTAVKYLESLDFKIVEQNYYAKKMGEIDIVAIKENVYRFIEVKSSSKEALNEWAEYEPVYNITPSKIRKIIKSCEYYMKVKGLDVAYCIDAVIVKNGDCELLENITF